MTEQDKKEFAELYADPLYERWALTKAQRSSIDELAEYLSQIRGETKDSEES